MELKPEHFRTLPDDFIGKIRDMPHSPLILVKANGTILWGKDEALRQYDENAGDVMLFAWAGKYSTDMFTVTASDLKKHYFGEWSITSKIPAKKEKLLKELQDLVDSL